MSDYIPRQRGWRSYSDAEVDEIIKRRSIERVAAESRARATDPAWEVAADPEYPELGEIWRRVEE